MKTFNKNAFTYTGESTKLIAFPLGGLGAGMFCMEGSGILSKFSLRHKPDLRKEPNIFAALTVKSEKGNVSRVLEGPVEKCKIYGGASSDKPGFGMGSYGRNYGLPRFQEVSFSAGFPFCKVNLSDSNVPLSPEITAWSPFVPGDADSSSLPVAALEYSFTNTSAETQEGVFYFCAPNFIANAPENKQSALVQTKALENGFEFSQMPTKERFYDEAYFRVQSDEAVQIDCDWFRGGWFDSVTMMWNKVLEGSFSSGESADQRSPGASMALPFSLKPGENKTVKLYVSWYVPFSDVRCHEDTLENPLDCNNYYRPWYASKFNGIGELSDYWLKNYADLEEKSRSYKEWLFNLGLPQAVLDSVTSNLSILKSPTVLRQFDGRLWGWEGCQDSEGSCQGSCTHVWNYAQAICQLFPELERSLRETEFFVDQRDDGYQLFRTPLPIRKAESDFFAASDGQLGGIIKVYRDWKICGDDAWLQKLWNKVKESLEYAIRTWDPEEQGVLTQPHHNTYDIEFWSEDSMCSSFYLGALKAASLMAEHLDDKSCQERYASLYKKGVVYMETELFNGEYFYQKDPCCGTEQPKYQYGTGCLSDGMVGAWLSKLAGLGDIVDKDKISSHLLSVYKYNFKTTLQGHSNPQRPSYAIGNEGGLLLCTWPRGGKPTLPFVHSDEVWTGIEHQVASHLALMGYKKEAEVIEIECRKRYDGSCRNPFSEFECGEWYARAMSSYALIESFLSEKK